MEGFKVFFALDVKLPGSSSVHLPSLKGSPILLSLLCGWTVSMVHMQPQGSHFRKAASEAQALCDRIFKVNGEGPALMNDC